MGAASATVGTLVAQFFSRSAAGTPRPCAIWSCAARGGRDPVVSQPSSTPKRVRVTRSRRVSQRASWRPVAAELDEQTGVGDVYLEGLMRAQFRLSVLVLILLVVGLGGLPVLLIAFPTTRSLTVIGVPFPWLVLAIAFYPTMWLLARWYAAQSARVERQFRDVLSGR